MPNGAQEAAKPGTMDDLIRSVTVDQIVQLYRAGKISAQRRDQMLRMKAGAEVEDVLEQKGFAGAILSRTIELINENWNDLKAATEKAQATKGPKDEQAIAQLKAGAIGLWNSLEIVLAPFNALGEVTGKKVEVTALRHGASPGVARVLGIAADVGTGFVPVGIVTRAGIKLTSSVSARLEARATERAEREIALAKEAGEGPPRAEADQLQALWGVSEGMKAEGVTGARKVLDVPEEITEAVQQTRLAGTVGIQETFRQDFARFQREMGEITERQTRQQTERMASRLGYTLDDLRNVVPGQALNEREMLAYLRALDPVVDEWVRLSRAVKDNPSSENVNAFLAHSSDLLTLAPKFRAPEVTAGRAVEVLKEPPAIKKITDMLMGWDAESMARGNTQAAALTMAEDIIALADEPQKLKQMAIQSQTMWHRFSEEWWPMAREFYTNLLLLRPITQMRNLIGNTYAATTAVIERQIGGLLSADAEKGLVGREAIYMAKGMMLSIGEGMRLFAKAYKDLPAEELTRLDFPIGRIPGVAGAIIRAPGLGTLTGMDAFFKHILRRGSYYATAARDGVHAGLKGDALADFISRRVTNPTKQMQDEAIQFARYHTFQQDLGALGKSVQRIGQAGPFVLWFPFMKTPINLAKFAWNRTPGLNLISKQLLDEIAAGGPAADAAIGRLTWANMQAMFLYELAKDGTITGNGPIDPSLRPAWLKVHKPYAMKLTALGFDGQEGVDWMHIRNAEPGTTLVGQMADFAQIVNQLDEPQAEQVFMAMVFSTMQNLADKTYWRTMGDLIDMASGVKFGGEPGEKAVRTLYGPLVTVTTGGPLVAAIAREQDPVRRETRGLIDEMLARTPGYSKDLPPMRDYLGDPVLPDPAVGPQYIGIASPLVVGRVEPDPLAKLGNDLQVRARPFPWRIAGRAQSDFDIRGQFPEEMGEVELNPKQRDRWYQVYKQLLRSKGLGLEANLTGDPNDRSLDLPNDPDGNALRQQQRMEFHGATRAMKRKLFQNWIGSLKQSAKFIMVEEDERTAREQGQTGLATKLLDARQRAMEPFMQGEELRNLREEFDEFRSERTGLEAMTQEEIDNIMRWTAPETPDPPSRSPSQERIRP